MCRVKDPKIERSSHVLSLSAQNLRLERAGFESGGGKYSVTTNVSIRTIGKESDRKSSEHLYRVLNEGDARVGDNYGAANKIGGKEVNLNANYVPNMMNGKDNNTIPHETGHTLGLFHPNSPIEVFSGPERFFSGRYVSQRISEGQVFNPGPNGQNANNAMYSGGVGLLDDLNSTMINTPQFSTLIQNITNGKVNKDDQD